MAVDRCICKGVTFESALAIARERGFGSVRELQDVSALGSNCGLCIPYMQRVLITGQSDQPVLDERARRAMLALAGVEEKRG